MPEAAKKFLSHSSATQMIDQLEIEYTVYDWSHCPALWKRLRNGNFHIKSTVSIKGPVQGFFIFSCVPESENTVATREATRELFEKSETNVTMLGSGISEEEKVKTLSKEMFSLPTKHMHLQSHF